MTTLPHALLITLTYFLVPYRTTFVCTYRYNSSADAATVNYKHVFGLVAHLRGFEVLIKPALAISQEQL